MPRTSDLEDTELLLRGPLRYSRAGHWLHGLPLNFLPSTYNSWFGYSNDFVKWEGPTAASASPGTGGWIAAQVGTMAVDVRDSATDGILRLITSGVDNDNATLQLNGSPFAYTPAERMWFGIRCAPQDADDGEIGFGLAIEGDTDFLNTFPTDGLFFEKSETATAMDFHARKDGVSSELTSLDTTAMADSVFHEYGFRVDTGGLVRVFYDGVQVGSVAVGNANLPNDEDLSLYLAVQTGAAATRFLDIDWVFVAQERT